MRPVAIVPLLALAPVLFAEDSPKNSFMIRHEWHGFKEGPWVEIRTKGTSSPEMK